MAENPDEMRMRQGAETAEYWLRRAVRSIDDELGDGYAKANPEVVAAMLAAASSDFRTTTWQASVENLAEALHLGLSNIKKN
jgi:hypothetical protein